MTNRTYIERTTKRIASLKSLNFGVELETVGISADVAAHAIKGVTGGDVAVNYGHLGGMEVRLPDGRVWKCVRDGSLRDYSGRTCEVVSPILTWADMDTLQAIARALRSAGGRVNESCGMHVHVDGAAFKATPAKVRNLIALGYRWESVAVNMAQVIRNRQAYCRTLEPELVDRFRSRPIETLAQASSAWYGHEGAHHQHYDESRYHWINVHALFDKGTVEFRLFNGTLHAGHVKANVLFALGMANTALAKKSVSFAGRTENTHTLPDGRRPMSAYDSRLFIFRILYLLGDEFATYRKHLAKAIEA